MGNTGVLENQDKIIPLIALRIKSLEETNQNEVLSLEELLFRLKADLEEAEVGRDEAHEAGLLFSEKFLERNILELRANIAELENLLDT